MRARLQLRLGPRWHPPRRAGGRVYWRHGLPSMKPSFIDGERHRLFRKKVEPGAVTLPKRSAVAPGEEGNSEYLRCGTGEMHRCDGHRQDPPTGSCIGTPQGTAGRYSPKIRAPAVLCQPSPRSTGKQHTAAFAPSCAGISGGGVCMEEGGLAFATQARICNTGQRTRRRAHAYGSR